MPAISTAQTCIDILKERKRGLELDKEMISDMYKIQGLCYLRSKELKKAGKCFEEAGYYTVKRNKALSILFKSKYCLN